MAIGEYQLNFSFGESQEWYWLEWQRPEKVIDFIREDRYPKIFGDLYFKLNWFQRG